MTEYNEVAIVGGGLSGATIAAQQMLKLIEHKTLAGWAGEYSKRTNITIYDKSGTFGPGEPYRQDQAKDDLFLLNQPAYAMSPFRDQPDHFIRWLSKKGYPHGANDFVSRGVYGSYLKDVFRNAVETYIGSGCGNVKTINAEVSNITRLEEAKYSIEASCGDRNQANIVVLAPGHSRSDLLLNFRGNMRYFDAPYDAMRASEHLKNAHQPALIIGTSQSMLDALAVLDHVGFEQQIYAISRNLCMPWLFDPESERDVSSPYEFQYLTANKIGVPSSFRYEDLRHLFELDLVEGKRQGYPMGHILSRFQAEKLGTAIGNQVTFKNFIKLSSYANALYGNPTSPQRYNLMKAYEKRGQLKFIQADVNDFSIEAHEDSFAIQGIDGVQGKFSAIFNSASYSMKAISDQGNITLPLLNKLSKQYALKRHAFDKNAFAFGQQHWPELYLAGPSCNSQRWGAETFRDGLADIAVDSVSNLGHHSISF